MNSKAHTQLDWSRQLALAGLLILIIIPLGMVIGRSFMLDGSFSLSAPFRVISERDISRVFLNSIFLGLLVVCFSSLIAAPLAFLMAKTDFSRHTWIDIVLLIPFMTPPYIASMGWILFMQRRGFLEQFAPWLSFTQDWFFSLAGIVMIMSLNLFPFIYLIMKNSLEAVGKSLEDAGAIHGGRFTYRMRRIVLPLVFSSYSMGALLIFVKTISEFGTPATLGRQVGFYVLTTEIYRYTNNWPIDFGKAAAIASILLVTSMLIWYVQQYVAGKNSWSLVGGKDRGIHLYRIGKWKYAAWTYLGSLLGLSIAVPYFSIIANSLMISRGRGLQLSNLSLQNYVEILTPGSQGSQALATSLILSAAAATAAVIIGTFLAITIVRSKGFVRKFIDVSSLLSNTVPRIVIIVGLIFFWNAPWMRNMTVYNTSMMLVLTYTVAFLPYSVQYVKAKYQEIDESLFAAGRICGANSRYISLHILFPLLKPGMIAGWLMTFIISTRELVASLMVRPPGLDTTATFIFRQFDQGAVQLGMAMALITVAATVTVLISVRLYQKKKLPQ